MQVRPSELQNQRTVEHRFIQQLDGQLLFAYPLAGRCGATPLPWPSNKHFTQVLQQGSLQRLSSPGLTSTPLQQDSLQPNHPTTDNLSERIRLSRRKQMARFQPVFAGKWGPKNRGSRSPYTRKNANPDPRFSGKLGSPDPHFRNPKSAG